MSNRKSSLAVLAVLLALSATPPAFATVAKTYVSRTGADAGTCTSAAPCATFAYAIGQTTAGGEISVVDSGEYGPVDITKSISIVAEGAEGGITVGSGGIGVSINNANVRLRGLTIDGSVGGGQFGIDIYGGSLDLKNCVIRGLADGIFVTGVNTSVHAENVLITDSGTGIHLFPGDPASGLIFADLTRVRTDGVSYGVLASSIGGHSQIQVQVRDSVFSNGTYGAYAYSTALLTVVTLSNSHSVGNQYGAASIGPQSVVILDRTAIQANTVQGLYTSGGGVVYSYGNNPINDNVSPGTSPTVVGLH